MKDGLKSLQEYRATKLDPYGLTKLDRGTLNKVSQLTEYDSFLFQDVLQLANTEQLEEFKSIPGLATKIDPEQNLYSITLENLDTLYYNYATMYNRLTNTIYAGKVNKSSELFRQFVSGISLRTNQEIKSAVSSHERDGIDERLNR